MRTRFLAGMFVLAMLAACGAPPVATTPTTAAPITEPAASAPTEASAAATVAATSAANATASTSATIASDATAVTGKVSFPRTLTHSLGTITIPAKPQRVVTLSDGDTDAALALGITPVAIFASPYTADGIAPWVAGRIDTSDTQIIPYSDAIPVEQIATLQPDLILAGSHFDISTVYDQLSQIAPTTSWLTASFEDSWDAQAMFAAQALGEDAAMEQIIQDTNDGIAQLKTDYPQLSGKTFSVSIIRSVTSVGSINTQQDFAVQFFQGLGLQLTPKLTELAGTQEGFQAEVSLEQLDVIDADLPILSFVSPELRTQMEANPLYQQLASVQNGSMVLVDLPTIAQMRGPTLLGIPWLIDQLRPAFTKFADPAAMPTTTTTATATTSETTTAAGGTHTIR